MAAVVTVRLSDCNERPPVAHRTKSWIAALAPGNRQWRGSIAIAFSQHSCGGSSQTVPWDEPTSNPIACCLRRTSNLRTS
jgi:hypothetical protein